MILLWVILFFENILGGSCCTTDNAQKIVQVNNINAVSGQSQTERDEEITQEAASRQQSNQQTQTRQLRTYADMGRSETVTLTKRQIQQLMNMRIQKRRS
jgi:hypothetical protein